MQIFKTFNTKTKEVKEYRKPEFGDFGEWIRTCVDFIDKPIYKDFIINTAHELNTLFNGLFKDQVYSNGDWIGVLQHCFAFKDDIYKNGDVVEIKLMGDKSYIVIFYDINFGGFKAYWHNKHSNIIHDLEPAFYNWYYPLKDTKSLDKDNNIVKNEMRIIDNLLDEYFAGSNKLAKLCNF